MKLNKYWFRPKKFGYGAYPHTKEGWILTFLFLLLFVLFASLFEQTQNIFYIQINILLIVVLVYLSYIKTEGKWKWRWG